MIKKPRTSIPSETAARVLFEANRTCCVCRIRSKPVQIHHIDNNPTNHLRPNLATLCFDCHRETQITGGFDRKLDSDQVVLYRDDWVSLVAQDRSRETAARDAERVRDEKDLAVAMSLAEIYREARAYVELVIHYDVLGNTELRDKYIEVALSTEEADDDMVIFLRGIQGRPDLIPPKVAERRLVQLEKQESWSERARALKVLERFVEAVTDYLRDVKASLEEERFFSAAYYLKELAESGLISRLFQEALHDAQTKGELWWQVRALQELEWQDELTELLIENASIIDGLTLDETTTAVRLKELLAAARGEDAVVEELLKAEALLSTAHLRNRQANRRTPSRKAAQSKSRRHRAES
jgi:hypothetical protein